jgi:hypothetical protein
MRTIKLKDYGQVFVVLMISVVSLLVFIAGSYAQHRETPVTPYGDFCKRCSHYGVCSKMMSVKDSEKAMVEYYNEKGLFIEIKGVQGRFIKAHIKDRREIVDIIIFDRKTGRVRSIY